MKAEELRIGNYVSTIYPKFNYEKVKEIKEKVVYTDNIKGIGYISLKPIPLTEEIVCNIKDIIKKNENTYILPNGLHIEFLFPEPTLRKPTSSETSIFLCDVEYLHELQNAYYWLSDKKELNIKL